MKPTVEQIQNIINAHWQKGFGNISAEEAVFISNIVEIVKPSIFIEVGVASGISAGLTALSMQLFEGTLIIGIDTNPNFLGGVTGRCAKDIFTAPLPAFEFYFGKNSLDIPAILAGRRSQMAFVDGNHQHPWATLDTIALLPFMDNGGVIVHHDLELYKNQEKVVSVGPKYLYDQFPESLKTVSPKEWRSNIYSIRWNGSYRSCEEYLINSLLLPWTNEQKISISTLTSLINIIKTYYSNELLRAFEKAWNRFS